MGCPKSVVNCPDRKKAMIQQKIKSQGLSRVSAPENSYKSETVIGGRVYTVRKKR